MPLYAIFRSVRNILVLLFCLAAGAAAAQQPALSGVVKDQSGGVVSGASVIVRTTAGTERQTVTGPDGRFMVDIPATGDATLIVRAGGFAEFRRAVTPSREMEVILEAPSVLESVTVTPTRTEQRLGDVPASVSIVDKQEIEQSPAVVADDVLRQVPTFSLFRRSSSLSSHPTSQGVSLRGIGPSGVSRTLVMTDGVPVNDPFGGWVYWTRVPLASVDRIEVVEGASSSLYGNYAEGGVINIVTARPSRRTVELKPQYGNNNTPKFDFFGSDAWSKVGVAVEGSLFDTDGFPIVAPAERGVIDINATAKFQNVNTKVDYAANDRVHASFRVGYFNEDRVNGKINEINDTQWTSASGTVKALLPDQSTLQATVFTDFERFHSTFQAVSAVGGVPRSAVRLTLDQHVPTDSVGGLVQWSRAFGRKQFFSAGTDWRWVDGDSNEDGYAQLGPLVSPVTNATKNLERVSGGTQRSIGAFAQDILTPHDKVTVTLSGRVDHWSSYDGHNLETNIPAGTPGAGNIPNLPDKVDTVATGRAAATYRFTDHVSVWGGVSSGFRAPTLNELYRQFRVGTVLTLANFDLNPERLFGGEGGVSLAITPNVTVRATGFANRVKDPVFNVTTAISGANVTQQRQNVPRTEIKGFQTDVEYHAGPFRASAAYMFNDAHVKEVNPPASPNIPSILGNYLAQVPKNRGSAQVAYANPKIITAAFGVQGVGDQWDDDLNTRQLPAYGVADLSLSREISRQFDVFFGVQNMFDKQYIVGTLPTTIGSPRLINGGVRVTFTGR
jgi:outer membrane receptor protein involved in Fe transport